MNRTSDGSKRPAKRRTEDENEQDILLESLRAHGQVVESDSPDVALGPGQTHVYVRKLGQASGSLLKKRKSFLKR